MNEATLILNSKNRWTLFKGMYCMGMSKTKDPAHARIVIEFQVLQI